MNAVYRHLVVCFLTGLVAILPVGGTLVLIVLAERSLSPLAPGAFYFPGLGLLIADSSLAVLLRRP